MDDMGELRGAGDLALSPVEESIAADLRAAFLVEPDPVMAERHVAAMVAASEARRAPSAISLATHRSRKALVAAGVAGAVLLGSAGVAAASGNLPGPLQRAVASACRPVGIDLPVPGGGEGNKSGPFVDEPTTVPPTSATSTPPTTVTPGSVAPGGVQSDGGSGSQGPNSGGGGDDPRTTPTTRPTDGHGGGSGGDGKGDPNKDGSGGGGGGGHGSDGGGNRGDGHGGGG